MHGQRPNFISQVSGASKPIFMNAWRPSGVAVVRVGLGAWTSRTVLRKVIQQRPERLEECGVREARFGESTALGLLG